MWDIEELQWFCVILYIKSKLYFWWKETECYNLKNHHSSHALALYLNYFFKLVLNIVAVSIPTRMIIILHYDTCNAKSWKAYIIINQNLRRISLWFYIYIYCIVAFSFLFRLGRHYLRVTSGLVISSVSQAPELRPE